MFRHFHRLEPGQPVVSIQAISKRFAMRDERYGSLQERFIRLLQSRQPNQREHRDFFWPIRDLSVDIYPGQSLGLIGPNGSGKSTLLKLIAGILEPTTGQITVCGRISSLLELGAGFHPDLTGRENIFLNGSIYGLSRQQIQGRMESIIDFAELGDFIDTPVKFYSSGMYVRLGFAVAIHTEPDLLLVDEVLAVGDQIFQQKCLSRIRKLQDEGVTIIMVSHGLGDIATMCDRAIWLNEGQPKMMGPAQDVADKYLAFSTNQFYRQEAAAPSPATNISQTEDTKLDTPANLDAPVNLEQPSRWGTFAAEITDVEFLDSQERRVLYYATGDPFCLRIHYRAHKRIERPAFGMSFYLRSGPRLTGPNSIWDNVDIPTIEGEGSIDYRIDRLPLLHGDYDLTVAIYSQDIITAFDHHHRMYLVEVRASSVLREDGIVHLDAHWQHRPLPDQTRRNTDPIPVQVPKNSK